MTNPNDLKVFTPSIYGGGTVSKGNNPYTGDDGTAYTPGIIPGAPTETIETYPTTTQNRGEVATSILVIDVDGKPLQNVHVKWPGGGTITDGNGEANISVTNENTVITITYVGKRTHIAAFKDLVNAMITLQENPTNLPPVVVKPQPTPTATVKKKNNQWLTIALGVGAIFLVSAIGSKGKTGSATKAIGLSAPKAKKRKKSRKQRKGLRQPAEITI